MQLTELEERLAAADGAALRTELAARLTQTGLRLKHRLAAPLPRDEFAAVNACLQATQAAQTVLGEWIVGTAPPLPANRDGVARRGWPF